MNFLEVLAPDFAILAAEAFWRKMSAASPDLLALSPRVTRIIWEAAEIARASGALDGHVADNGIATAANQMPPTRRPVFPLDGTMPVDRTRPPGGPEAAKPGTVLTF